MIYIRLFSITSLRGSSFFVLFWGGRKNGGIIVAPAGNPGGIRGIFTAIPGNINGIGIIGTCGEGVGVVMEKKNDGLYAIV